MVITFLAKFLKLYMTNRYIFHAKINYFHTISNKLRLLALH